MSGAHFEGAAAEASDIAAEKNSRRMLLCCEIEFVVGSRQGGRWTMFLQMQSLHQSATVRSGVSTRFHFLDIEK